MEITHACCRKRQRAVKEKEKSLHPLTGTAAVTAGQFPGRLLTRMHLSPSVASVCLQIPGLGWGGRQAGSRPADALGLGELPLFPNGASLLLRPHPSCCLRCCCRQLYRDTWSQERGHGGSALGEQLLKGVWAPPGSVHLWQVASSVFSELNFLFLRTGAGPATTWQTGTLGGRCPVGECLCSWVFRCPGLPWQALPSFSLGFVGSSSPEAGVTRVAPFTGEREVQIHLGFLRCLRESTQTGHGAAPQEPTGWVLPLSHLRRGRKGSWGGTTQGRLQEGPHWVSLLPLAVPRTCSP